MDGFFFFFFFVKDHPSELSQQTIVEWGARYRHHSIAPLCLENGIPMRALPVGDCTKVSKTNPKILKSHNARWNTETGDRENNVLPTDSFMNRRVTHTSRGFFLQARIQGIHPRHFLSRYNATKTNHRP